MKKIVACFSIIFILFIYFCTSTVQAVTTTISNDGTGVAKFDDCKIVSWMKISDLRLTLPNNLTVAELKTDDKISISKISNPIDILFILDVSGSMSGNAGTKTRIQTLKDSTKKLISELSNKYEKKDMNKLRISILSYSTKNEVLFDFTECTDDNLQDMYSKIDSLAPNGSTETGNAIQEAKELWNSSSSLSKFKYTILITDGNPTDQHTKNDLENFKKEFKDINFLTILIGSNFRDNLYEASDNIIHTSNSNFESEIVNGIYNFIFWYFVDANSLTTTREKYGIIEVENGGDFYMATLDNELVYGSTLCIEYNIVIKTTEAIDSIKVIDYLPPYLNYDPSALLLTEENKKNQDYKWKYDVNSNTVSCNVRPTLKQNQDGSYEDIVLKLSLSAVLASNDDISYLTNEADITITTPDNNEFTTLDPSTPASKFLHSKSFSIIPPTGRNDSSLQLYATVISLNLLLVIILKIKNSIY